jgi:pSer/pThr/pTyr-binding forkhead associated (FHA) protein
MLLQLVVIAGPDKDKIFPLHPGTDNLLGRAAHVLYRLNDLHVSRSHCQITREGDLVTLVCLGGSGGTRVNGKPIKSQVLKPGDVIQVGET